MIKGIFLPERPNVPIIQLVIGWGSVVKTLPFVLDTGFSGDLQVSKQTADELGLEPEAVQRSTIANGITIEQPVASAIATMEAKPAMVTVSISNGMPLAGIGLFTKFGYKIIVDCLYRTVELEKAT